VDMSIGVDRREFLLGAAAASAAASAAFPGSKYIPPAANALEPSTRASARLLVGCCALSYLRYFNAGTMTMEKFVVKCAEMGVQGVDVTTYWLASTGPEYLTSLRHLAFKNGIPLSGVAIRTEMCQAGGGLRAEEVRKIQQWVDVTEMLGSSHLRVFGGSLPNGATEAQGINWVVECMKPACEYAGKKGITLGIESHGGITARASMILEILRKVDSPFAGVNLDITNFEAKTDEEMYSDVEACVPQATHVHVRDVFSTSKGPVDLERMWKLFAKGNYKGYMSAEYEGEEDPMTGVPKLLDKIKTLCRKYSSV
jgi:sugar phosphate isomerase/epimerase